MTTYTHQVTVTSPKLGTVVMSLCQSAKEASHTVKLLNASPMMTSEGRSYKASKLAAPVTK